MRIYVFLLSVIGVSPEYENENECVCDIESVTGTGPSHKQPNLNNTIYVSRIFKDNPFPRYIKHIITYICGLLV